MWGWVCGCCTEDVLGRADADGGPAAGDDAALLEDAWGDRGSFGEEDLDGNEGDKKNASESQQCYNSAVAPLGIVSIGVENETRFSKTHSIGIAAPLECE